MATLGYKFENCILCLKKGPLNKEHIIPEFLGGNLKAYCLCKKCNSRLGHSVVADSKAAAEIVLAIGSLRKKLPDLYNRIIENSHFYATAGDKFKTPYIYKKQKNKYEFVAKPHTAQDGSLIVDTKDAPKHLCKMMKKDGLSDSEISSAIETSKSLENYRPVQLTPNIRLIKREAETFNLKMPGKILDLALTLTISFEYLALLIGNSILDTRFDYIRKCILKNQPCNSISINSYFSRPYKPYHSLSAKYINGQLCIQVCFFGALIYKISYHNTLVNGKNTPCPLYLEDLLNKKSFLALSIKDAEEGVFYHV